MGLDIFGKILNVGGKIDGILRDHVAPVLHKTTKIMDYALPAAGMVASLTPTPADDLIVAALKNLNLTASKILAANDDPDQKIFSDGARLALAAETLKLRLLDEVKSGNKIDIGDVVLDSTEAVLGLHDDELKHAVHTAYMAYKKIRG